MNGQNIYSYYEKKCNDINNLLLEDSKNDKLLNDKMILDKNYQKSKKQLKQATIYLRDNPAGIILSSALIIKWQNTAYIIIDGYDENYKNFNAKHLLVWKLMIRYSKLGFKNFNLGGVVNPEKVNKKYKGLNEFKLSFGSNIVEYIGDFELITNSPLYFMYQKRTNLNNMLKK